MICSAIAALVAGLNLNQALIYVRHWHKDGWPLRSAMLAMIFLQLSVVLLLPVARSQ